MLCGGALVLTLAAAGPAEATLPNDGKLWRPPPETTGPTWSQVASVCSTDGASRCDGVVGGRSLTGWVWATQAQVIELMGA
jgi:hypothetical protein